MLKTRNSYLINWSPYLWPIPSSLCNSNQLLPSNKYSSLSLLKNYDVLMVQSTNCIIILVPIPPLPKPAFLTALMSCKHSCRFSLRNTGYPMRKLTIHCGNRPPIKCQGKLPLTQHNITSLLYKTQLLKQITFTEAWYAPHIHKSFHSHIFTSTGRNGRFNVT